jgi:phage baseplate assembly protein W
MAIIDYNKNSKGVFDQTQIISKTKVYSDLDLSFVKHPNLSDITPLRDIDAVKQAVKNLVLTNFYERPFHPEIGGNVSAKLFEPADRFTASEIRDEIKQVLKKYEPRVNGVKVQVFDESDANRYVVNILFNVIFLQVQTEVSFNLQRLR